MANRRDVRVAMVADRNKGLVGIGFKAGALGGPVRSMVQIDDLTIAGALDDPKELGPLLVQVGTEVMAQLLRLKPRPDGSPPGVTEIATALGDFLGGDFEDVVALMKASREESPQLSLPLDEA